MSTAPRARRVPPGAEIALAALAGAGTFVLVAVVVAGIESDVPLVLLGVLLVAAVVALARRGGIAYAVPIAMAGVLAYDWFHLAPVHPLEFPDTANLVDLLVYLAVGVLIGGLAAAATRHARVSEEARARIAEEQAALRRVATRVAQGLPSDQLLATVAEEAGTLLAVEAIRIARYNGEEEIVLVAEWSKPGYDPASFDRARLEGRSVSADVLRTGRVARIDDYDELEQRPAFAGGLKVKSVVGAPILVEGRIWGVMAAWSASETLPAGTERRLTDFTELVATAIANTEARREVERLVEEQAALRRVATLVAEGVPPYEVFVAVAREIGQLLRVSVANVSRYERDGTASTVGSWTAGGIPIPAGTRAAPDDTTVSGLVFSTGTATRLDNYDRASGEVAAYVQALGIRSSVGAPISLGGQLWGVVVASSDSDQPLPADTESRIAAFTDLVATSIGNTDARSRMARLADEQAALRRVATLVALGVPRAQIFESVIREVGLLCDADLARLERYESNGTVTGVGVWSKDSDHQLALGTRFALEGLSIAALVHQTGRPMRVDSFASASGPIAQEAQELGIRSSVGCPIVVQGRLWGVIAASSQREAPFPSDTESQIGEFTALVATAIANSEARAEVKRLADGQAALRRVATLVAEERPAEEVFAKVAEEVGKLLRVDATGILRYEPDSAILVAEWSERELRAARRDKLSVEGENITGQVFRTGQPARFEYSSNGTGEAAEAAREMGVRSAVGCPVVVQGRLWGLVIAMSMQPEPLSPETETRIGEFTDLVATSISNLEARADLAASRTRIVEATDQTRRRFERDLHDGVQQRLVSLMLELRGTETVMPPEHANLRAELSEIGEGLTGVLDDLRELSRGIHPAILSEGGLGPALRALARRSVVPVELDVSVDGRFAERVEVAAYYVISEALANTAKHAQASVAEIQVESRDGILELKIQDDGQGGADPTRGSGLTGLTDRVEALGGKITITSPTTAGTTLHVQLPAERP
ncbi:MAG TPA: GAF domain-containing protein [Kribbella sp.]|uniref:GAF domain-containing protein n=1 Tax=Kribbella sp. TaxID=1871183 RepID=UPI002D76571D|nr:GAF domain-containing protein [Kribbella sp.]HET6296510.1 GAF domain-containing protein [Kribbella sp.]